MPPARNQASNTPPFVAAPGATSAPEYGTTRRTGPSSLARSLPDPPRASTIATAGLQKTPKEQGEAVSEGWVKGSIAVVSSPWKYFYLQAGDERLTLCTIHTAVPPH